MIIPEFPGDIRKNDALFMYLACHESTSVFTYEQTGVEVVHGPSCIPDKEIYLDICNKDNVPVRERRSGGGTVILSPGMVITVLSGVRTSKQSALDIFHTIHETMIAVFKNHGISGIEESGISDLSINNLKIAGSSLYMGTNPMRYYYQSSIMVNSDITLIDKYLKHPPREPQYRGGRSHVQFCTTLHRESFIVAPSDICRWLSEEMKLP